MVINRKIAQYKLGTFDSQNIEENMRSTKKTITYLNSMDHFTSTTYLLHRVAFELNFRTPSFLIFKKNKNKNRNNTIELIETSSIYLRSRKL